MILGMSGPLVSEYFAEHLLSSTFQGQLGEADFRCARRRLVRLIRNASEQLGPASSVRQLYDEGVEPLLQCLGFAACQLHVFTGDRALTGVLPTAGSAPGLVLLVAPWGDDLDGAWRRAVHEGIAAGAEWCLCANGTNVRIVDTARTYARRFLDFDLRVASGSPESLAVLWGLTRRQAFEAAGGDGSLFARVVAASVSHTTDVCRSLKRGVLDALGTLLRAFGTGPATSSSGHEPQPPSHALEQALTVVYRILFLLFAESRHLLPTWHTVYRDSYSMEAARSLAESVGEAQGLWETLQAIARIAHAGCLAGDLRVTPFNGRLFAPELTPRADQSSVSDADARDLLLSLSCTRERRGGSRSRIVYRDLDVEQLGAVYETALDYQPGTPPSTHGRQSGAMRKSTGTFYTPRSITTYLVRRTLAPLVAGASPEQILALRVVDPAMGSGAFLVAACRFLASAYEAALVEAGGCHPADIDDPARRGFRRLVAQRCLYGVDLNPMAVQLARLSLWLVTLAPDRPLTFLDHRLLVGDSLVGASVEDVFRRPPPGTRSRRAPGLLAPSLPLPGYERFAPDIQSVLPRRSELARSSDDTLAAVRRKERLLRELDSDVVSSRWRRLAGAWCAHGFVPGRHGSSDARTFLAVADACLSGRDILPEAEARRYLAPLEAVAASRRFFHWPLEFPEAFYGDDGNALAAPGFDAVLGNPPWDVLRSDNEPAPSRGQGASTGSRDARTSEAVRAENAMLLRFARECGGYAALGNGHVNRYQLFVERAFRLARAGGRIGLVVPWGLLGDQGCEPLRHLLFDQSAIDAVVGFDNSRGIFPIHRSIRFLALTATKGDRTDAVRCRLQERSPFALDSLPSRGGDRTHFPLRLTRDWLSRVSHGDLSLPQVQSGEEVTLLDKLYRAGPGLGDQQGWGIEFGRELNATDDASHFETGGNGIPVLEGKHVSPFRVRVPANAARIQGSALARLLPASRARLEPRLAYRDVASATNRVTLIAAVLPEGCVTVHTLFCSRTRLERSDQHLLCAFLNSFVVNYLARLRVTSHVSWGILRHLPVPRLERCSPRARRLVELALALATSESVEDRDEFAELQALVAATYGLTAQEFSFVLDTFPLVPVAVRDRCLAAYGLRTTAR